MQLAYNLTYNFAGTNLKESNCSSGDLRLTESVSSHYGKLEICFNRAWGGVYQESGTIRSADVSCRQLGFLEHYGKY